MACSLLESIQNSGLCSHTRSKWKLNKQLLQIDATATRTALKAARDAIRPMLYMLRTVEENDRQRVIDART